jgi:hypothetical protein
MQYPNFDKITLVCYFVLKSKKMETIEKIITDHPFWVVIPLLVIFIGVIILIRYVDRRSTNDRIAKKEGLRKKSILALFKEVREKSVKRKIITIDNFNRFIQDFLEKERVPRTLSKREILEQLDWEQIYTKYQTSGGIVVPLDATGVQKIIDKAVDEYVHI